MAQTRVNVFWFRRDLRLHDNTALLDALRGDLPVLPLFIFDREILQKLEERDDPRVSFIHNLITFLGKELAERGGGLLVRHGNVMDVWEKLLDEFQIQTVYTNRDYEPGALKRDEKVRSLLADRGVAFETRKDQVIFEQRELLTGQGKPYTVYTPYRRRWMEYFNQQGLRVRSFSDTAASKLFRFKGRPAIPALKELGFEPSPVIVPAAKLQPKLLQEYGNRRDFPALDACSRLGPHLRFGTVSVREMVKKALRTSEVWLGELIWREFFMQILANFPHVVTQSFRPEYDSIKWRNDEKDFARWTEGRTGYPLVDAGMRELTATGYMHNRVRMLTASFLTKHLLIDWRQGERWFARKLLDFELASNNGNWQWAAGTGCDAAPYFRVFNPEIQLKKFDKQGEYTRRWVSEFGTDAYPKPMVEHAYARNRALAVYKAGLDKGRKEKQE